MKGYFRLVRCLYELEWIEEAEQSLYNFTQRFPTYAKNKACKELEAHIKKAVQGEKDGYFSSSGFYIIGVWH